MAYEIVERRGLVVYKLDLLEKLSQIYDIFYISMLHKYTLNPSYVLKASNMKLSANLSNEEQWVQILDRKEK